MTATTRLYIVKKRLPRVGEPMSETRLVRAANQSQALRFVAADTLVVSIAAQDDLVELIQSGVKVETVADE